MNCNWFDIVILVLALNGSMEVYWHSEMPLLTRWRARLQAGSGFFSQLGRCPWCSSHWVGMVVVGLLFAPGCYYAWWPGKWVLLWIAIVRAANLLNDLTHNWHRTPRDHS